MERIQAAIAKARAARDAGDTSPTGAEGGPAAAAPAAELPAAPRTAAAPVAPPAEAGPAEARSEVRSEVRPEATPARPARPAVAPEGTEAAWLALPELRPRPSSLRRARVLTLEAGAEALPFDVLRTRMLLQMKTNGWRRVGITSAAAGAGKSVLALNLAFSLARQPDQRTLLIEADLRRPVLARYMGLKQGQQVAQVLAGTAALRDHAARHGLSLAIATQSRGMKAPAEILQSAACREALDRIEAQYAPTVMLFDLPPLSAGDDVMALAGALDAMLIVAAAEQTTIRQVDQAERELAPQVSVMGVVLTKCRYPGEGASYGYGY